MSGTYDHRSCGQRTAEARAERDEARAALAVVAAERDDLGTELDKLKAQHRELLSEFTATGSGYTARLSGVVLARKYTAANLPVRDDLSHLAGQ